MLVHLSIHNYAIVEQLDLELLPGMTVITGETGAGKSIMLDALGLALGARADSSTVRPGAERADIQASFDLQQIPEARQWLAGHDLDQESQCLLRRVITREGRSRAYINGVPCPQGDLRSLGSLLIDIHSQHEHQSLLKPDTHRRLLDEYAGGQTLAGEVRQAAQYWRQCQQALARISQQHEERLAHQQLLGYQLEELEQLALGEHELEKLEQEHRQLANAGQLLQACQQVIQLCSDSESGNVLSGLANGLQQLSAFPHPPKALQESLGLLANARIQVEEAVTELTRFTDHFEADPARLQSIETRLDAIYRLARKHRIPASGLPALQQQLAGEMQALDASDEQRAQLEAEMASARQLHTGKARELSQLRSHAAPELARAVEAEIHRLGMPGGLFAIALKPLDSEEPQGSGLESVEFTVSTNPGQPLRPLARVASGGELSRISLAIQVITARTSRVPTLVFDEVDVGIGGPTAETVGQLLRQLGQQGQILTVTHLPQVAAQGHQHLFVHKARGPQQTHTRITRLDNRERSTELARMLGGLELTEESLAHARQMLDRAQG